MKRALHRCRADVVVDRGTGGLDHNPIGDVVDPDGHVAVSESSGRNVVIAGDRARRACRTDTAINGKIVTETVALNVRGRLREKNGSRAE